MIHLSNGHSIDFCVASGALGYDGKGWWFEKPWRWLGLIRPSSFTIITKTLTYKPRQGHLKWWCPWRSVRLIENGIVNAVGLTNPGYHWWIDKVYPKLKYKTIVSIAPENIYECQVMIQKLNELDLVAIQLNLSCPNSHSCRHVAPISVDFIANMTNTAAKYSKHPLILKLSYDQPFPEICIATNEYVEAFELINSVKWRTVNDDPSPLLKYGYEGGMSGPIIRSYAETALMRMSGYKVKPIISGGGIYSYKDVEKRHELGAKAFSFGTIFIKRPWLPNIIARKWRKKHT